MKYLSSLAIVSLMALSFMLAGCQRDKQVQAVVVDKVRDPLALENAVSIASDQHLLQFQANSAGDKALRDFETATGCRIGLNKLSVELVGVKNNDLVIARRELMAGINTLAALDSERLAVAVSIDKTFQANAKAKTKTTVALQWSPIGIITRSALAKDPVSDSTALRTISGPDQLENAELQSARISAANWRNLLGNNPNLNTAWTFTLPSESEEKYSVELFQMAINKKAEHPNCAYALMSFLLTPMMQAELAKEWQTVPVVKAACYGRTELDEQGCINFR
jgi:hypothetical protein